MCDNWFCRLIGVQAKKARLKSYLKREDEDWGSECG